MEIRSSTSNKDLHQTSNRVLSMPLTVDDLATMRLLIACRQMGSRRDGQHWFYDAYRLPPHNAEPRCSASKSVVHDDGASVTSDWLKLVARWSDSGLSAQQFAVELGVSQQSLTFSTMRTQGRRDMLELMKSRATASATSCLPPAVPSAVRPLVDAACRVVRAVAPEAVEIPCQSQKPRSPSMMWKLVRYAVEGEVVVTIGTFSRHASMFFARGAELDDGSGLLEGTGKMLRYITLRTPADAKSAALKAILREAFKLAASAKVR